MERRITIETSVAGALAWGLEGISRPFAPADGTAPMEQTGEQDRIRWGRLYDAHHRWMYLYCYARTGDRESAASFASNVFLNALDADRGRVVEEPAFSRLYSIARELLNEELGERAGLPSAKNGRGQAGDDSSPMERAEGLPEALRMLPALEREVVALRYYAGCARAEIAAALEASSRAVQRLEARALGHLCGLRPLGPEQAAARRSALRPFHRD